MKVGRAFSPVCRHAHGTGRMLFFIEQHLTRRCHRACFACAPGKAFTVRQVEAAQRRGVSRKISGDGTSAVDEP